MQPLHSQRYFCRFCFARTKRRSTTVISSDSSNWPLKTESSLPHFGHPRSAASSSKTFSTTGRAGCSRGPCPTRGFFSGASVFSTGRFSDDFPKSSLFFTASCASSWASLS